MEKSSLFGDKIFLDYIHLYINAIAGRIQGSINADKKWSDISIVYHYFNERGWVASFNVLQYIVSNVLFQFGNTIVWTKYFAENILQLLPTHENWGL